VLRSAGAGATGALAVLVVPLAVLTVWVSTLVSDTDAYVETVAPIAQEPVVQRAVVDVLTTTVMDHVELDQVERALGSQLGLGTTLSPSLDTLLRNRIEELVRKAATSVVEGPAFAEAWADANRVAHAELVGVLSGKSEPVTENGRVSIPLAALYDAMLADLADAGIDLRAEAPDVQASISLVDRADLTRAREVYRLVDLLGWWLPVLAVLVAVVSLFLARHRRRTAMRLVAGTAVAVALMAVALRLLRVRLLDQIPGDSVRPAASAVVDALLSPLREDVRLVLVVLLVVLVGALLARPGAAAWARRTSAGAGRVVAAPQGSLFGVVLVLAAAVAVVGIVL
jgi:hypothetical protein